jgi:hypothetical protein
MKSSKYSIYIYGKKVNGENDDLQDKRKDYRIEFTKKGTPISQGSFRKRHIMSQKIK